MKASSIKPDMEVCKKYIDRDHTLMVLLCLSVILLCAISWLQDWPYKVIFSVMAFIAAMFLGNKKDFPDDNWSPQQKADWTKRYTTIKIKNNELVYVSGNSPNDIERFNLDTIDSLFIVSKKLMIKFKDKSVKKVSAKFWSPNDIDSFIKYTNGVLRGSS